MKKHLQEPRADIEDPQESWCPVEGAAETPPEDVHDNFIRLMGGDPPKVGGHASAVTKMQKLTAMPALTEDGEWYFGPVGIIPAVYRRKSNPPSMSAPEPAPTKQRKTSKKKAGTSLPS